MTLQNYLTYCDHLIATTEHLFLHVPPDRLDWKPTESSFTIGQQLAHLVGALEVYAHGITRGEWGFASMREILLKNRHTPTIGVEEAVKMLYECYQEFRTLVGSLSEEEFSNGTVNTPQLGIVPRWRIAMLAAEHHINHKAELYMYLKVLGVKVNSAHLYRGKEESK